LPVLAIAENRFMSDLLDGDAGRESLSMSTACRAGRVRAVADKEVRGG
jgi:hypothetical protein